MPVVWDEDSYFKKEMRKWDAPKRLGGMNADGFLEYPRMLYKAQFNPQAGRHEVLMDRDVVSADRTLVILSAELFNASCQMTVNDEEQYRRARADGWRESPKEAMAYHKQVQDGLSRADAERAYADRNMSEAAQKEIAAAVAEAGGEHVPEIPAKRRGRPRKSTTAAA